MIFVKGTQKYIFLHYFIVGELVFFNFVSKNKYY